MYVEARKRLIEWVRRQLVGPPAPKAEGEPVLRNVLPTERFPCGAIYPVSSGDRCVDTTDPGSGTADTSEDRPGATELGSENATEPAVIPRYAPPSSLGFSFFVEGDDIRFQVLCRAVSYEHTGRDEGGRFANDWTRQELIVGQGEDEEFENVACPGVNKSLNYVKLKGKARATVRWRRFKHGWIVTVSLSNTQQLSDCGSPRESAIDQAEKTLFEVGLRCVIDSGTIGVYPRVDRSLLDKEEQEIELQYAYRHIYAIGHGCAADWKEENGRIVELRAETMPAVEVPLMTALTGSDQHPVLTLSRLARIDEEGTRVHQELFDFVGKYAEWIETQRGIMRDLPAEDRSIAERMIKRMETAVARMRASLKLLRDDPQARTAFAIANDAMLSQMRQQDVVSGRSRARADYRWRPFQLAFLLTTLEATANEESEYRDTVDLIWFPTGGGKTEAYLGLMAFLISLRRLRHTDTGGGTAVIMRYTLRLLTRDQFTRAARLICALELIRRQRSDLGKTPITIGMWVGAAASPNTFRKAAELVQEAQRTGSRPALVVDRCPWCSEGFRAERNYESTQREFHFLCRNRNCDFGTTSRGVLPCNVVDEALYDEPPTMLVATIDKFARLAWEERANAFFGGEHFRPPELIIQDELHLIAGALGSIAGLYEAALDTVLQHRGVYPKYIASTATIRMAKQQVKRLYGRDVAVFPPPGLTCDDAYFARTIPTTDQPGRTYVGYLAPRLGRRQCLVPLAAALLAAPEALFQGQRDEPLLMDAWWTQVVYHGSLEGVGNSHTVFSSQVQDFIRWLTDTTYDEPDEGKQQSPRFAPSIAQLTSRQTAVENAKVFSQLRRKRDEGDDCLDVVLATNMISVGLDVARLALMIINGQPLTTAEYIQASSRVGRGEVPGVIFVNYYRDQARSLSHYESFRPYHEAFYRFVEPTSVTPYSFQARLRALHAALVIVMRHSKLGLLRNDAAAAFDPHDASVASAIERLKSRCRQSCDEQATDVDEHIGAVVNDWQDEVHRCRDARRGLRYYVPDNEKSSDRLLYNHDDRIPCGLWPTLHSLRYVEKSVLIKVL